MQIIQKPVEVSEGCWLFWSCEGLEFSKCIQRVYIPSATAFPRPISRHRRTQCTSHCKNWSWVDKKGGAPNDTTVTAHKSQKTNQNKNRSQVKSRTRLQQHLQQVVEPGRKKSKNKFTTLSSLLMGKKNTSAHHRYFLLATFRLIQSQSFQQSPV